MARVLMLTLVFPPDGVSTAVLMGDLAVDLRRHGHDVTVMTTVPHYNTDTVAEARQPLRFGRMRLLARSEFHGVPVIHAAMPKKDASRLRRLLAWAQFHVLSLVAAMRLVRQADIIVAPSPPLTIGVCAWLLGRWYRAPFVYNVQELYPDIAIRLGAVRNGLLVRGLFTLERFVYARASAITVIADGMRRRVLDKGVPPGKVRVVPNFVDVEAMTPLPRENTFRREHDLRDRFVVTYAGNLGPAQGLETALDAAALLRDDPRVLLLFVGGGGEQDRLTRIARDRGLANVRFVPHQPYARVPEIYAASDLCLVPLSGLTGYDAVPSKVYRIMACARPLLAQTIDGSDLADLVHAAGAGFVVAPDAPEALAAAIRQALADPARCAAMGAAGRAHVLRDYTREAVSARYEALLRELVAP